MMRVLLLSALVFFSAGTFAADYDALIHQAITERNAGRFQESERLLREAHASARVKTEAAYLLAMVIAFQQRFEEAHRVLDIALKDAPHDRDLLVARARVHSYQGSFEEADDILEPLIEAHPQDLELRNLSARILLYQQRPLRAKELYLQSLDQAPADLDTLIGLHDSHLQMGEFDHAQYYLDQAALLEPNHADVRLRQGDDVELDILEHELLVGSSFSRFDITGFDRWKDYFVEYRHHQSDGDQQYARVDRGNHFGLTDYQVTLGLLTKNFGRPVEVAVSVTPDANFFPEAAVSANTSFVVGKSGSTIARPSFRVSKYTSGSTQSLGVDVDHYLGRGNTWFTVGVGVVNDENDDRDISWGLGVNHQLTNALRIGIDYVSSPETNLNRTTETDTYHGYLRWQFDDEWYLRLDASHHDRKGSYSRTSAGMTLSTRF